MYISLDQHLYSRRGYNVEYKNNNTTLYITETPLYEYPTNATLNELVGGVSSEAMGYGLIEVNGRSDFEWR